MNVQQIAKVCHELNMAICKASGDDTQKPWDQAEQWQKESAVKGVQFALENPEAPASAQHEAWMADKEKEGWVYGETKDAAKKEHPCMVPYDKLPFEQKIKDYIFKQTVASLKEFIADGTNATTNLSFGQQAVGITFNPGGMPEVNTIKQLSASLIDELNNQRAIKPAGEVAAQFTLAIRKIQEGQMWGVKATTWQY